MARWRSGSCGTRALLAGAGGPRGRHCGRLSQPGFIELASADVARATGRGRDGPHTRRHRYRGQTRDPDRQTPGRGARSRRGAQRTGAAHAAQLRRGCPDPLGGVRSRGYASVRARGWGQGLRRDCRLPMGPSHRAAAGRPDARGVFLEGRRAAPDPDWRKCWTGHFASGHGVAERRVGDSRRRLSANEYPDGCIQSGDGARWRARPRANSASIRSAWRSPMSSMPGSVRQMAAGWC